MTSPVPLNSGCPDDDSPRLIVARSGATSGDVLVLRGDRLVLGRAPDCDLRLDHPHVSGAHALLRRSGDRTVLKDMSSTNGTWVNSVRLKGTCRLNDGDVIRFGSVEAVFREPGSSLTVLSQNALPDHPPTKADVLPRPVSVPRPPDAAPVVRFASDRQEAGQLNNVGGNQYNQYLQQMREDRESFLREIAGTRSRARWLVVVGFIVGTVGFGIHVAVFRDAFRKMVEWFHCLPTGPACISDFQPADLFGPDVLGMPLLLIAIALYGCGACLMLIGLVLHIIAASRRRYVETALGRPLPPLSP
ncbi:FHA domain-containing protein [Streptomyces galilaeus]